MAHRIQSLSSYSKFFYPLRSFRFSHVTLKRSYSSNAQSSVLQQVKADLKLAMRQKNQRKLNVLKGLLSDITYLEKNTGKQIINDTEIASLIHRAIAKRDESIAQFTTAGRQDLVAQEQEEASILREYLGKQLSEDEIKTRVLQAIKETDAQNIRDMGKVMHKLDGINAPRKTIADMVKKFLKQ
ncbi:uncharacterized protein VTP21DRAFT_1371 [Calcarisporiella thermophila]|uniref:uncharacterized protein n=1 Tax=Calcarisporiella thermophila TaxID=911321 RepID=UPI003742C45B